MKKYIYSESKKPDIYDYENVYNSEKAAMDDAVQSGLDDGTEINIFEITLKPVNTYKYSLTKVETKKKVAKK